MCQKMVFPTPRGVGVDSGTLARTNSTSRPGVRRGALPGRFLRLSMLIGLLILSFGCPYSVRGNLPAHLSTVQIPAMHSQVSEYGLEQQLTSMVVEGIVSDGRLAVVNTNADAVLTATVTSYARTPYSYTSAEVVEEYKLQMGVRISFEDQVQGVPLLDDETVSEWIVYDPDTEAYADARDRLMTKIAGEIVRRSLSGW